MLNKFETFGIFISIALMALALFLINVNQASDQLNAVGGQESTATVVLSDENPASTLFNSVDSSGNVTKLIIDDVAVGSGPSVEAGDTVSVHYVGTLQNGQEFDSSYSKDQPFSFTVGGGQVIQGWEEGLIGMKAGGQRILVIPASMAYGDRAVGPIPPNATLVFAIELLEVNPE